MKKSNRREAILYVASNPNGDLEELYRNVSKEDIEALEKTGIIHRGQAEEINTYMLTNEGKNFMPENTTNIGIIGFIEGLLKFPFIKKTPIF